VKIVLASDSYKGCLSSKEVALAARKAVLDLYPDCETAVVPVADGGEGTVDAIVDGLSGRREYAVVSDPLGRPVRAEYGIAGDLAIIECASACGLTLLSKDERNPLLTSTRGLSYTTFTFSFNDRQDKDSNGFLTISDSSSSNTYPFHWGTDGITYTDSEPSYKVEVDTKQFTNTRGTGDLEFLQALEVTIEGTPVACKSSKTCTGISCNSDSIKTEFYKNEIHYIDENLEVYKLYSDGTKETLNPLLINYIIISNNDALFKFFLAVGRSEPSHGSLRPIVRKKS